MTTELILAEIESDPAHIGYAGLDPRGVHDLLSAPVRSILIEPSTPDVANFLINRGMTAALMVAQENAAYAQFPDQLKVAIKFVLMLNSSNTPTMNFSNAVTNSAVAGLVASGLWRQSDVDALIEKLAARTASRAVELWRAEVSLEQVARALWGEELSLAEDELIRAQVKVSELKAGIDNA